MASDNFPKTTALLNEISRQTDEFAAATGLRCKEGCGKCCENPEVETTVAEVMPLAAHLWKTGQAQDVWDHIKDKKVCIFYKPDSAVSGNGRCSVYEFRPGICRLFGFAAKRGKNGQKDLVTCRIMKEQFPAEYAKAQKHIADGRSVASISDHGIKVQSIDPHNGRELLPINQAVKIAIERTNLRFLGDPNGRGHE